MDVKIDAYLLLDIADYFFKLERARADTNTPLTDTERRIIAALDDKLQRMQRRCDYKKQK